MKIIINGADGRMGRFLAARALEAGDEIVSCVDARYTAPEGNEAAKLTDVHASADVLIDFSSHLATGDVLDYCLKRALPAVIAPTGQTEEELAAIHKAAKRIPIFLSANLSLGVAVLSELAAQAVRAFPEADIEIVERHHNQKKDAPSGTALLLARRIREKRGEAQFVFGRSGNAPRQPGEIGIHALRYGREVGTHEIIISTGRETLTLKHEAETRELFADGALAAARYLLAQKPGLYDMRSMLSGQGER